MLESTKLPNVLNFILNLDKICSNNRVYINHVLKKLENINNKKELIIDKKKKTKKLNKKMSKKKKS